MSTTPLLGVDEMAENDAAKFVKYNEGQRLIEAAIAGVVSRRGTTPSNPSDGDLYIVLPDRFAVTDVDTSSDWFKVAGDQTGRMSVGDAFEVQGSTGNDGDYTISALSYDSNNDKTQITVQGDVTDSTADGDIRHAEGTFNAHTDEIAFYIDGGGWRFIQAPASLLQIVADEEQLRIRDAKGWRIATLASVDLTDAGTDQYESGKDAGFRVPDRNAGIVRALEPNLTTTPTIDGDPLKLKDGNDPWPLAFEGEHIVVRDDGNSRWLLVNPNPLALDSDTTFHVDVNNGDDTNTGLDSANPKKTIQSAIDFALQFNTNGFKITILCEPGTYDETPTIDGPTIGGGFVRLEGNGAGPRDVVITGSSGALGSVTFNVRNVILELANLQPSTDGSNANDIAMTASIGAQVRIMGALAFDSNPGTHLLAEFGGGILVLSDYEIDGIGDRHLDIISGGQLFVFAGGLTLTLNNTPSIGSEFIRTAKTAVSDAGNWSFSGSATGRRYLVDTNGVIDTGGGGSSFFPGNSAGVTQNGGVYV